MTASIDEWFEAVQLLTHEAQLLDERRYDEWLELFTDDAVYWVPIKRDDPDPQRDVSIAYDDRARLGERVRRLGSGFMYAQEPPSRTCHVVGGVGVTRSEPGERHVRSSFVVTEVRGREQSLYSGSADHVLRQEGGRWRIARKTVRLTTSDLPLGNVTFIL